MDDFAHLVTTELKQLHREVAEARKENDRRADELRDKIGEVAVQIAETRGKIGLIVTGISAATAAAFSILRDALL